MKNTIIAFMSVVLVAVLLFTVFGVFDADNSTPQGKISFRQAINSSQSNVGGVDRVIQAESYFSPIDRAYNITSSGSNSYNYSSASSAGARSIGIAEDHVLNSNANQSIAMSGGGSSSAIISKINNSTLATTTSFSAQMSSVQIDGFSSTMLEEEAITRGGPTNPDVTIPGPTTAPIGSTLWLLLLLLPYCICKFR